MRLTAVCDKKGWAYDSIARSLKKYLAEDGVYVDIIYKKSPEFRSAEAGKKITENGNILWMGWSLAVRKEIPLPKRIFKKDLKFREYKLSLDRHCLLPQDALVGIHAHHDWDDRATRPEKDTLPPDNLVAILSKFKKVNTVSSRLYRIFKKAGLKNIFCTPNGVDDGLFYPKKPLSGSKKLRVGYAGTRKRDWKEGISGFIDPLRKIDFIDLKLATPEDNYITHDRMPGFYNEIDVYLCASLSEGFSLSVLEASGCGRPVLSTRVGGSEELLIDGHNGLFVNRDLDDIVKKLRILHKNRDRLIEMGKKSRAEVEKKWSWKVRSRDWLEFIRG